MTTPTPEHGARSEPRCAARECLSPSHYQAFPCHPNEAASPTDLIIIDLVFQGDRSEAHWQAVCEDGDNQAHALSKLISRLRRRKECWGRTFVVIGTPISGVIERHERIQPPEEQAAIL